MGWAMAAAAVGIIRHHGGIDVHTKSWNIFIGEIGLAWCR